MFFGIVSSAAALLLVSGPVVGSDKALEYLKAGNARFVEGKATHPHQDVETRHTVAKGQAPFAIVLTCADSRLSPEVIFDQGLGDLFVLRVAGNIAEPGSMASVEYAVEHLGARLLIVLGHERCGAVKAAVDSAKAPAVHTHGHSFSGHKQADKHGHSGHAAKPAAHAAHAAPTSLLPALIAQIAPSVKQTAKQPGDKVSNAVSQNVINTVNKVSTTQPLKKFIAEGKLTVVGSVYDLDSGVVKNIFKGGGVKAKCGCCGAVKN